ncbi:hypothetical protein vseg_001389 [Gypsophila vaccaria]
MACAQVPKGTTSFADDLVTQYQGGAQVVMNNQTGFVMTLDRSHNWSGKPASGNGIPYSIGFDSSVRFTHLGDSDFGSSGAVIYAGANASMMSCAWVLAWDAPTDSTTSPNKVYVACGPKGSIDALSFDQIRNNLEYSTTVSQAIHPSAKIKADAEINDSTPNTASVGATFALIN